MTYSHALCWNEISIYDNEKLDRNNIVKVVRKNHFSTFKCLIINMVDLLLL